MRVGAAAQTGSRGLAASADLRRSSTGEVLRAIAGGDSITVGAYVLGAKNPLVGALVAAADRGADVHVRLGTPYVDSSGGMERANETTARLLEQHHVDVHESTTFAHAKAAIVDGSAFLDDRNWSTTGRSTVIADSRPADVAAMRQALDGNIPPASPTFGAWKPDALRIERDLIDGSSGGIDVVTENIGYTGVSKALLEAATREPVRLVVAQSELRGNPQKRRLLEKLAASGVQIRLGRGGSENEKFCLSGDVAWVGSANASWSGPGSGFADWGLRTADAAITAALHTQFAADWRDSKPFVA